MRGLNSGNRPLSELMLTITGLQLSCWIGVLSALFRRCRKPHDLADDQEAGHRWRACPKTNNGYFFQNLRTTYLDSEWQGAEKKFSNAINRFDHLGWVKKLSAQGDELEFEIKPAIHRLTKLYAYELNNFAEFAANLIKPEES